MERHTYFLPRYDDTGAMQNQGHALAAAQGIACLLRRWAFVREGPTWRGLRAATWAELFS